jgi:hypothetical protein
MSEFCCIQGYILILDHHSVLKNEERKTVTFSPCHYLPKFELLKIFHVHV